MIDPYPTVDEWQDNDEICDVGVNPEQAPAVTATNRSLAVSRGEAAGADNDPVAALAEAIQDVFGHVMGAGGRESRVRAKDILAALPEGWHFTRTTDAAEVKRLRAALEDVLRQLNPSGYGGDPSTEWSKGIAQGYRFAANLIRAALAGDTDEH